MEQNKKNEIFSYLSDKYSANCNMSVIRGALNAQVESELSTEVEKSMAADQAELMSDLMLENGFSLSLENSTEAHEVAIEQ